jgi:hypothetical protein
MVEYYKKEMLEQAKKQRKTTLRAYFIVLGVYLLASAGVLFWFLIQPYEDPTITWVKVTQHSLSALLVIFSFIYLGIRYKRVNRYYKMMYNLETGIRETSTGSFFEYSGNLQDKNVVDFKALIFLEWNKYKKDFFERKVLVFDEMEFPKFEENSNVRYVTQGNVLVSYEVID